MMTVTVLDRAAQTAAWGNGGGGIVVREVTISTTCPKCGGPRGAARLNQYCEDGEWYSVHNWDNPCGHVDLYTSVLAEAFGGAR